MKTLALALLIGISSITAAHAEWEILDRGTAVAQTQAATPTTVASGATVSVAQRDPAQK